MEIVLFVEPLFKYSFNCKMIIEGLEQEIHKKRYKLIVDESADNNDAVCVILADDKNWLNSKMKTLKYKYKKIISINNLYQDIKVSNIISDYETVIKEILKKDLFNKSSVVLYGVDRKNFSDCNIEMHFRSNFPNGKVFYNDLDLLELYNSFVKNFDDYDAVVCTNDIIATSLSYHLKKDDLLGEIPILSLGRHKLTGFLQIPVRNIENDLCSLGAQAVFLASYINKSLNNASVTVKQNVCNNSNCYDFKQRIRGNRNFDALVNEKDTFDAEERELIKIEHFLRSCDSIDLDVLSYLLQENVSYSIISELLFITENTLKYRIKRLKECFGTVHKSEMLALLKKYYI